MAMHHAFPRFHREFPRRHDESQAHRIAFDLSRSARRHEHAGSPRAGSAKSAFARKAREVGENRGN
jgi:hypothetical protein